MARISFERGVPSAAAQLVGAGLGVTAHLFSFQWWVGWGLFAFGFLLLVWGFRINGKPWWRMRRKRGHRQLYVYTHPVGEERDAWKSYHVSWSPTVDLGVRFSTHQHVHFGSERPPEEKNLSLYVFNAGPEDVRHVEIQWGLPDVDPVQLIRERALFDGHIIELTEHCLELSSGNHGALRSLGNPEVTTIPLIKAHETVRVASPEPFTGAIAIACLAAAKQIQENQPDWVDLMKKGASGFQLKRHLERPMPEPHVDIRYTLPDGSIITQHFVVMGLLSQSGLMRKRDDENVYEAVPDSLSASLSNLLVMEK